MTMCVPTSRMYPGRRDVLLADLIAARPGALARRRLAARVRRQAPVTAPEAATERVEPPRLGACLAAPRAGAGPAVADERAAVRRHRRAGPRRAPPCSSRTASSRASATPATRPPRAPASSTSAGRTLMPGLIDAHAHVYPHVPAPGARAPSRCGPGRGAHFLAADLRAALRMGITTIRDVGSYGDLVFEARQAMRYGAFRGPRLLTCGRIISATAPGGRWFGGMYREADGPDDVRRAVREQTPPRRRLRQGHDDRRAHGRARGPRTPRR